MWSLEQNPVAAPSITRAVFLVQLEVADRLAAPPNSDAYGALSVFAQRAFKVARAFVIRRGAFYPQPNVDSAVVTLEPTGAGPVVVPKAKSFHGSVEVNPTLAKSKLNTIADEVLKLLASDPNATVRITLEIDADFPNGASDTIKRGVSENATSLGFKTKDWE